MMRIRMLAALIGASTQIARDVPAQTPVDNLVNQAVQALASGTPDGAAKAIGISRAALVILGPEAGWQAGNPTFVIARAFITLQMPDSAAYYGRRGVSLYRLAPGQQSPAIFVVLATAQTALNQRREARATLADAIREAQRAGDADVASVALHMMGRNYISDPSGGDSALIYLQLANALNVKKGIAAGSAGVLRDIAFFYGQHGIVDSALMYGRRALAVRGTPTAERAEVLHVLALIYARQGEAAQLDSALNFSNAALSLAQSINDRAKQSAVLVDLGAMLIRRNKDSALKVLNSAIPLVQKGTTTEASMRLFLGMAKLYKNNAPAAITDLRAANEILRRFNTSAEWQALSALGSAYYVAGQLDSASTYAARAFDQRSKLRSSTGDDFLRVATGEDGIFVLDHMWTSSWLRRRNTNPDAAYAALAATDRTRAQALNDLMSGIGGPERVTDYAAYGRGLVTATIADDEAILYYRIGLDSLTIWALTRAAPPVVVTTPVTPDLVNKAAADFLSAIGARGGQSRLIGREIETDRGAVAVTTAKPASAQDASARLSSLLFPPEVKVVLSKYHRITIVPHAIISAIPFTALSVEQVPLGQTHSLRFTPSLSTLKSIWRGSAPASGIKVGNTVVVGNPVMPSLVWSDGNPAKLLPLPGSEKEATEVARQLNHTAFLGAAATETAIRKYMPTSTVIHLATHGFAYSNPGQAGYSFIALAPDATNDGMMTVNELVNTPELSIMAQLVVLSACQSGLGSLTNAEGTVGLQRAFLARGAKSLLVSLWNVSDEATQHLMTSFYSHWLDDKDSPSKPEALRRAQEDVRKIPGFADPKYWAAFQLVGAN